MSLYKPIQDLLQMIFADIPHEPTECAIISFDGLTVATLRRFLGQIYDSDTDREENKLAPMGAAMLSLGERVIQELHGQTYQSGIIGTEKGIIWQRFLGEEYMLIISWENGITVDQFYQSWDDLQKAIEPLRKKLEK